MKNYLITAGIALAVVLLTLTLMPQKVINSVQTLGAVSSPDIQSPYFSFGGARQWAGHTTLNQASTTICAMRSPAATSTLRYADVKITSGTTTALFLDLSGGGAQFDATSTVLGGTYYVASGAQATVVASTSSSTISPIFSPNTYFLAKYTGAAGALNVLVGECNAVWAE